MAPTTKAEATLFQPTAVMGRAPLFFVAEVVVELLVELGFRLEMTSVVIG